MRILVVGAGAIGGYFGGRLLRAGRDVTFLVRPRRAAQLKTHGLAIRSRLGDFHDPAPPLVTEEGLGEPFDLVILSCKAYDLDGAIASFAKAVGPGTAILPLLNGMRQRPPFAAPPRRPACESLRGATEAGRGGGRLGTLSVIRLDKICSPATPRAKSPQAEPKSDQPRPRKTKEKDLDFLGFIRPIRGFSMGYGQTQSKKIVDPAAPRRKGCPRLP